MRNTCISKIIIGLERKQKADIYFGPIDVAAEMLVELQTKPLIDEKIITCSCETILKKMANSTGFAQVLEIL